MRQRLLPEKTQRTEEQILRIPTGARPFKEVAKETAVQRSRREGLERGMEKERRHLVLSMFQENADISFICKVTGLSEEEIEKLKNGSRS